MTAGASLGLPTLGPCNKGAAGAGPDIHFVFNGIRRLHEIRSRRGNFRDSSARHSGDHAICLALAWPLVTPELSEIMLSVPQVSIQNPPSDALLHSWLAHLNGPQTGFHLPLR